MPSEDTGEAKLQDKAEQLRRAGLDLERDEGRNASEGLIALNSLHFVQMLVSEAPKRVHDGVREAMAAVGS
mgnify:CR=1 FL=1